MITFRLRFDALRLTYGRIRRRMRLARALVGVAGLLAIDALLRLVGRPLLGGWSWILLPLAFGAPWLLSRLRRRHVPSAAQDAADLDRRFKLADLLTTAVDVDRRSCRTTVEDSLLADASKAARYLDQPRRLTGGALRREAEAFIGLLALAAGLHLLGLALPLTLPERMPELVGLGTGNDPSAGQGGDAGDGLDAGSTGAGSAAGLAAALGDQGAGREIAQALSRGRPQEAAAAARRLADQAGRLSEAGRRDLAQAMQAAAGSLPPEQADLKQALLAAATALQAAGPERETRLGELASRLAALAESRTVATVMPLAPDRPAALGSASGPGAAVRAGGGPGAAALAAAPGDGPQAVSSRVDASTQPLLLPAATVMPQSDPLVWSEREWLGQIQTWSGSDEEGP